MILDDTILVLARLEDRVGDLWIAYTNTLPSNWLDSPQVAERYALELAEVCHVLTDCFASTAALRIRLKNCEVLQTLEKEN